MKRVNIISTVVQRGISGEKISTGNTFIGSGVNINDIKRELSKDFMSLEKFKSYWEIKTDPFGNKYLYSLFHIATNKGVTMYSSTDTQKIPSILESIPTAGYDNVQARGLIAFDSKNFVINNGVVSVISGSAGVNEEQLNTYLKNNGYVTEIWVVNRNYATLDDLDKRINNLINGAPAAYDTLKEIADVLQGNVNSIGDIITTLGTKWTQDDTKIANWDAAYSWGDHSKAGYAAKSYVDSTFVPIKGDCNIEGIKNFIGSLQVNGSPIVYDKEKGYWYFTGDMIVSGGITMFGNPQGFEPSTIMDGVHVDGVTIIKENGRLVALGGGGSGGSELDTVAWGNVLGKPSWITDEKPECVNPFSLSWNGRETGSYNGSMGKSFYIPVKLSELTDDVVSGKYLPLTGGTIENTVADALRITRQNSSDGVYVSFNNNENGWLGGIGIGGSSTSFGIQPLVILSSGTHQLYHSGNLTPTEILTQLKTVDGANSGLDADMLDGYHESDFFREKKWTTSSGVADANQPLFGAYHFSDSSIANTGTTNGQLIAFNGLPGNYQGGQFVFSHNNKLYSRIHWGGIYGDWKQIAFTDSDITGNAATATKLKTAVKIWGKDFDGSTDVSGTISQVRDIIGVSYIVIKSTGLNSISLQYNSSDATTVSLYRTAFRPHNDANGVFDLGLSHARWNGIYGQALDIVNKERSSIIKHIGINGGYALHAGYLDDEYLRIDGYNSSGEYVNQFAQLDKNGYFSFLKANIGNGLNYNRKTEYTLGVYGTFGVTDNATFKKNLTIIGGSSPRATAREATSAQIYVNGIGGEIEWGLGVASTIESLDGNVPNSGVGIVLGSFNKGSYGAPIGRGAGIAAVAEGGWYNYTGIAFYVNHGGSNARDEFTEKMRLTYAGNLIPKHSTTQTLGSSTDYWGNTYTKLATIDGVQLKKSQNDTLYLDGNLVVRGGITMYGTDATNTPSILDSLPKASYGTDDVNKGIASFDGSYFRVTDGYVSLIPDNVGLNESKLEEYLAPKLSKFVDLVNEQTITGVKKFTSNQLTLSSHLYRYVYDEDGWVYDHYYNHIGISQKNTIAALRVKSGDTFKTLRFGGDGIFTWFGNIVLDAANFNSYAPTLTGGGASGNWNIYAKGITPIGRVTDASFEYFSNSIGFTRGISICRTESSAVGDIPAYSTVVTLGFDASRFIRLASVKNTGQLVFQTANMTNNGFSSVFNILTDKTYGTFLDSVYLKQSSYTAADILAKLKTVDGANSGLDADTLDGNHASRFIGLYTRSDIGSAPNYDNPSVNGLFEMRESKEVPNETGTKPVNIYAPFFSIKSENVMMQITGRTYNNSGWYIRGKQDANVTLEGVAWERLVTEDAQLREWNIKVKSAASATNATNATNATALLHTLPFGDRNLVYTCGQPLKENTFEGSSSDSKLLSYPKGYTYVSGTYSNIINLRLNWGSPFFHDIFASPNHRYLWHRHIENGNAYPWSRIVLEDNETETVSEWNINAKSATSATSSTKAYQDGNGDVIINTYLNKNTGGTINGNVVLKTSSNNQIRLIDGNDNYGVLLRNDGYFFYILTTNEKDSTGSWNSLRPFIIHLPTGTVELRNGFETTTGVFKGQIQSDVANGTAPFVVASKTNVTNLNADMLDGLHSTSLMKFEDYTDYVRASFVSDTLAERASSKYIEFWHNDKWFNIQAGKIKAHSGFEGSLTGNASSATKLNDDSVYSVWGQTFFENGKPKNVSGDITANNARFTGNVRIQGQSNGSDSTYGTSLYFGDGQYCYISEPSDDKMALYAYNGFRIEAGSGTTNTGIKLDSGSAKYVDIIGDTSITGNMSVSGYTEIDGKTYIGGGSEQFALVVNGQIYSYSDITSDRWMWAQKFGFDTENYMSTKNGHLSLSSSGNEICISGTSNSNIHVNYRTAANGYAPSKWIWLAGSSGSYAAFSIGDLTVNGNILSTGGITMYSQRSLKNVVDERGLTLNELSVIKPTRYTWKDGRDSNIHIGGIADDIKQVLPEVVYKTSEGVLTMDYGNAGFAIAASLIKPVVDHEEKIRQLQKRVSELEQELNRLRA